jgi:nucleotide-binding universal stress UspA family protein
MYRRILVPTDGTERAIVALDTALRLAAMSQGMIIAVHASPPPYVMAPELGLAAPIHEAWRREREQLGQDAVAYVRRCAGAAQIPCETLRVQGLTPCEAIVRTAREQLCDLIVMASRGRGGLAGRLMGSETWKVLGQSAVPVLVLR